MSKALLSKAYPVRLNLRVEKAWNYLKLHKLNPAYYLREGGEKEIIRKANEFYFERKNKEKCPF
jgi:predicted DNA-binding protein